MSTSHSKWFYIDRPFAFPSICMESCAVWSCCAQNAWGVKIGVHYIAQGTLRQLPINYENPMTLWVLGTYGNIILSGHTSMYRKY
jgi:hypothetical protein